jgi:uncharacterized membrane protein
MITGAILSMLVVILTGVFSILPTVPVPSWVSSGSSSVTSVFQAAGLMSVWFPITLASTVLLAVLAIYGVGFTIKFGRIVISLLTGGGGGAA